MSLETSNQRDLYPFDLAVASASAGQRAIANYIQNMRLCIQSNTGFTSTLKQVTAQGLQIQLKSVKLPSDMISVNISFQGKFTCSDQRFIADNSYITFIDANKSALITGTYNIDLLPQVLLHVPSGLIVHCTYSPVEAKARSINSSEQINRHTFSAALRFVPGYNFQPAQANASAVLVAGTALGKGIIPVQIVKQELGQEYAGGNFEYVYGVYAINGQTKQVNITAQGSSIFMQQSLQNDKLTIQLSNLQPGEQ